MGSEMCIRDRALGVQVAELLGHARDQTHGHVFIRRFQPQLLDVLCNTAVQVPKPTVAALMDVGDSVAELQSEACFRLLLDWLERLVKRPELPAEAVVVAVCSRLDTLLSPPGWPAAPRTVGVLRLVSLLLRLAPSLVLRCQAGSPSRLLVQLLQMLTPHSTLTAVQASVARVEFLRLLPQLLRSLRPSTPTRASLDALIAALRALLEEEMPLRFGELDAQRKVEVEEVWMPLLDVVGDPAVRSRELLGMILRLPAVVESASSRETCHSLADGFRRAAGDMVQAVALDPCAGGASAAELWSDVMTCVFAAQETGPRWEERLAAHQWVGLPLVEAMPSEVALLELLEPSMPVLARFWTDDSWPSRLPSATAALCGALVMRRAAYDLMGAVISRVSTSHLEPRGRLLIAAGSDAPESLKQTMVKTTAIAAKEWLQLPAPPTAETSEVVVAKLKRQMHVAAYGAFCEMVLQTQSKPETVNKLLFNWKCLWHNVVDPEAKFELPSSSNFATAPAGAFLASLTGVLSSSPLPSLLSVAGAGGFSPSQALYSSSLSLDMPTGGSSDVLGDGTPRGLESSAATPTSQMSQMAEATPGDPSIDGHFAAKGTIESGLAEATDAAEGEVELDCLNRQPIMGVLMRAICRLRAKNLELSNEHGMPIWMDKIRQLLVDESLATYPVRLLAARLALNMSYLPKLIGVGVCTPTPAITATSPPDLVGSPSIRLLFVHAPHWVGPLARVALETLQASGTFHYLARRLVHLVADLCADGLDEADANLHALLSHLVERASARCEHAKSLDLNVDAVRALLGSCIVKFGSRLQLRRLGLRKMLACRFSSDEKREIRTRIVALDLLDAIMANGLAFADDEAMLTMAGGHWRTFVPSASPAHGERAEVPSDEYTPATPAEMLTALTSCLMHSRKRVFEKGAKVLGAALAQMSGFSPATGGSIASNLLAAAEAKIYSELAKGMGRGSQADIARLLVQLDRLSGAFPRILELNRRQLGLWARRHLTTVHGDGRVNVLNCLAHAASRERARATWEAGGAEPVPINGDDGAPQITRDISDDEWSAVLGQTQREVQLAALGLLEELAHVRPPTELLARLPVLQVSIARHREAAMRGTYQRLLRRLSERLEQLGTDVDDKSEELLRGGLLLGLRDADDELRASALDYWHERLPKTSTARLTACFEQLYAPAIEAQWLHMSAVLLLQLVHASPSFRTSIFERTLLDGMSLQVVSLAPTLDGASVAMQPWGASFFTQSQQAYEGGGAPGQLRATQPAIFSLTQTHGASGGGAISTYSSQPAAGGSVDVVARTGVLPPVPSFSGSASSQATGDWIKDPMRGQRSTSAAGMSAHRRMVTDAVRQRQPPIAVMRTYRSGEVPDIGLAPHDFFTPLARLAHHDPLVAKHTLVHLYDAIRRQRMLDGAPHAQLERLRRGVSRLLSSHAGGPAVVACLHELALTEEDTSTWLEAAVVADSAHRTGTVHSAVRILEQQLLAGAPEPRRSKKSRSAGAELVLAGLGGRPARTLLIELYRSLGDEDVVRGLAAEVASTNALRAALEAEARGDSGAALEEYEAALQQGTSGEEESQLAQRGRRACLLRLGRWTELLTTSEQLLAFSNVRLGSWREAAHEPWVRMLLASAAKADAEAEGWVSWRPRAEAGPGWPHPKGDKDVLLEVGLGYLLVLERLAARSEGEARALLPDCVNAFIGRWSTLNPRAKMARLEELPQLQILAEAEELLSLTRSRLVVECGLGGYSLGQGTTALLASWRDRCPSTTRHDAVVWDDFVRSRTLMYALLREGVQRELKVADFKSGTERRALEEAFEAAAVGGLVNSHQYAAQAMRTQGDFEPARAHVLAAHVLRKNHPTLVPPAGMAHIVGMLRHRLEKDAARQGGAASVADLREVWQKTCELALSPRAPPPDQLAELCALRAEVASLMLACGGHDGTAWAREARSGLARLLEEGLGRAGARASASHHLPDARLKLVDLCIAELGRLSLGPEDAPRVAKLAFSQVARAMGEGSLAARDRLPTALSLLRSRPQLWAEARMLLDQFPAWLALKWTPQLLATMAEPHGEVVVPLIERMARAYPSKLYHPFTLSRRGLEKRIVSLPSAVRAAVGRMAELLRSPRLERLALAFEDLTHPHLRLKDTLDEVLLLMREGRFEEARVAFSEGTAWLQQRELGRLPADVASRLSPELSALCGPSGEQLPSTAAAVPPFAKKVSELVTRWRSAVTEWEKRRAAECKRIVTFSPYLAAYHAGNETCGIGSGPLDSLELPAGNADAEPLGHERVVAEAFADSIRTMDSLRRPKQLTIYGSDQRVRRFLVKGGEDLRQDARVQQIFGEMRRVLETDSRCTSRGLTIRTYSVLALNERVGLIEWIEDTSTMLGLIRRSERSASVGRQPEVSSINQADESFRQVAMNARQAGGLPGWLALPARETVGCLERSHAHVHPLLLARGLLALSAGAESYLSMRSAFARSLAVLTIAGHVLGIGDRHLDNFMVEEATGCVVGIDFGHAFGSATYLLPQPELMGVRLTRQLTSVLLPLDTGVLLRSSMVHVLRALRGARSELLRVMDVFVSEPLLDWANHARKLNAEQRRALNAADVDAERPADFQPGTEVSNAWVRNRMAAVEAKLSGGSSAHVTLSEVRLSTIRLLTSDVAQDRIREVVLGPAGSLRRTLPASGLSPEQQVDVLIEQATDPEILGRTYFGWRPWL